MLDDGLEPERVARILNITVEKLEELVGLITTWVLLYEEAEVEVLWENNDEILSREVEIPAGSFLWGVT